MDVGGIDQDPALPSRSIVAALIVISRYLNHASPSFAAYLGDSIDHAAEGGVAAEDLAVLRTLLSAVGGAPSAGRQTSGEP